MEKKKIIVFDKRWEGHIPTYHKLICKNLLELGYEVYSYSPNPKDVKEFINNSVEVDVTTKVSYFSTRVEAPKNNDTPSQDNIFEKPQKKKSITFKEKIIHLLKKNKSFKTYYEVLLNWRELNTILLKNHNPKDCLVFIPYLDLDFYSPFLKKLNIEKEFEFQWLSILFNNKPYRNPKLSEIIFRGNYEIFKSKNCRALFVLDEFVIEKIKKTIGNKIYFMPDITDLESNSNYTDNYLKEIRENKKEGKKIVLLCGVINEKKNIKLFIETIKDSKEKDYLFVIAGITNEYYWNKKVNYQYFQNFVEKNTNSVLVKLDGLKDGIEYNSYVVESDCIFVNYKNFYGSSNTLTKSSFFKKPVIVGKGYLLEDRIKKWKIGEIMFKDTTSELLDKIETATSKKYNSREFQDYFQNHTEQILKNIINQSLRQKG